MFLFLSLAWACVAAAQCHEPHLQKRDWVDGDRHCSYRESVIFESLSPEFDKLVGPSPKATALITGEAMALSAHEGAVFLEYGAEGEAAASLLFTTKPYEHSDGRRLAAVKRLVVDGPTAGRLDTLFESETVWKSNFGRPTPSKRRRPSLHFNRTHWLLSTQARAQPHGRRRHVARRAADEEHRACMEMNQCRDRTTT